MNKTRGCKAIGLVMFLALAGCGDAPSEDDLKSAVKALSDAEQKGAGMFADMLPKIAVLKKIGCKSDGENAYLCDVELQVTQGKNVNNAPAQLRFVKTSEGWRATPAK